jgi:hypothetical protein
MSTIMSLHINLTMVTISRKSMGPMTYKEHYTRKRWCNLSHSSRPSSPLPTVPPSLNWRCPSWLLHEMTPDEIQELTLLEDYIDSSGIMPNAILQSRFNLNKLELPLPTHDELIIFDESDNEASTIEKTLLLYRAQLRYKLWKYYVRHNPHPTPLANPY